MKLSKDGPGSESVIDAVIHLIGDEELIVEIQKRIANLSWYNDTWVFLQEEPGEFAIAKKQWANDSNTYNLEIGVRGIDSYFLSGVDPRLLLSVYGAYAPKIRDFLHGSPPIGQIGTNIYAVVYNIEPDPSDFLDNLEEIVIQPVVNFFNAYGELGDDFTRILVSDT
jgi:hypothetical protein